VSASAAIALSKLATGALPTAITVASANLVDGTIVDADVAAAAAIAGTKISPDFGSQDAVTTGTITAAKLIPTGASATGNGVYLPAANVMAASTNGSERLRIDSSGSVLVNATDSQGGHKLGVFAAGAAAAYFSRGTNTGAVVNFYSGSSTIAGSVQIASSTTVSYATSSDYRLKENATPLTGALNDINELNPVSFTWKHDGSAGRGFIAHELQAVAPEAVSGDKDAVDANGNIIAQQVDVSKLVPLLVAAVQELSAKVAALESK